MASREKVEKYPLQIINAGLYRCGTTSLSVALQELGFGPTWHIITNTKEFELPAAKWWVENHISQKLINGEKVDFDEWFQEIQCKTIMDTPVAWCWEEIFAQYPSAKAIICVRPFDEWYKSYTKLLKRLTDPTMTMAEKVDPWIKERRRFWHHYHTCDEYNGMAELYSLDESRRRNILKTKYYDGHIEKVKKTVPAEQLLILNPSDGWKPLCKFLNVPIPNKPYPHLNTSEEHGEWFRETKNSAKQKAAYYAISMVIAVISIVYFAVQFRK